MGLETWGTLCFASAILHTFGVSYFQHLAHLYPEGSIRENLFHWLGEIEVVFGVWSLVYLIGLAVTTSIGQSIHYLESLNFTEPVFVFVIMVLAATQPILIWTERTLLGIADRLPVSKPVATYWMVLVAGPIAGSVITEPAAMTVCALLLLKLFFSQPLSTRFKYATLGLLFVNVSIGGTLTPYAAPPVLMVASKWGWDLGFMLTHFGWKAVTSVLISTALITGLFWKEMRSLTIPVDPVKPKLPGWVLLIHLLFLAGVVSAAHHLVVFVGLFLFFLGFVAITQEYQSPLKLREGLLVGFFLAGLVVLGGPQQWWLIPTLGALNEVTLFFGATVLTAVTDNAALTYLGAQVPHLSDAMKYALVAGAVAGGGLTAIANAPNPVGFGILSPAFGKDGIRPLYLLAGALGPTLISVGVFFFAR